MSTKKNKNKIEENYLEDLRDIKENNNWGKSRLKTIQIINKKSLKGMTG